MTELNLLSALLLGLAGSVHCVAMCGGIVGALSFSIPPKKRPLPYELGYHFGRLFSYTCAGAITGGLGMLFSHQVAGGIHLLTTLSALFLLAMALYIGNWWRGLSWLEKQGARLWKPLAPLSKRFIPFKHPVAAIPYGMIWGWLPCGLVYSTLTWSMASGSSLTGALTMFTFGLGTLPALLTLGRFSQHIRPLLNHPRSRLVISIVLAAFAAWLLLSPLIIKAIG
ncbi:sulfite exporter TauE/SafE family protein [Bowmanella sp. Y26]|uniref:sulfite exporter TauE/SafE family protein n=1 Tax=Bowmanella yangjiangensis TaxID=2811230 RepID=UPI001BDC0C66|nr:sulfite exporter TauE/SafE family protein [Bowmanella yangjiangensis]